MKNTYLTSHFPLISIFLYSTALALYAEEKIIWKLHDLGVYNGMMEFFSESGIKLTLLFLLLLFFFMVFAALKLIADTTIQLSLLFFSKDEEGAVLTKFRSGTWIYLISSVISLVLYQKIIVIFAIIAIASFGYFIFFVYKVNSSLTTTGLVGIIFFHIFFWFSFILSVSYAMLKLYNSFIASLPV